MTAPLPPEALDAVAKYLHDEVAECVGGTTEECGRWKSPVHARHAGYYRDHARAVLERAAPAIRAAERERMAARMPSAIDEAAESVTDLIMEAVAAERERIRQLAIQRTATYRTTDDADPSPFAEEFADLLGGEHR